MCGLDIDDGEAVRLEVTGHRGQRRGDIPLLVTFFIDRFNSEFRKHIKGVADGCMARLEAYDWPGNVRELRNAVERAMLLADSEVLSRADFMMLDGALASMPGAFELPAEGLDFAALERDLVRQALERVGGNQTQAAGNQDDSAVFRSCSRAAGGSAPARSASTPARRLSSCRLPGATPHKMI